MKRLALFLVLGIILISGCNVNDRKVQGENISEEETLEQEIVRLLNASPEIEVTVKIKDGPDDYFNLNLEETLEIRKAKSILRDDYFDEKRNQILSNLSEDEFRLKGSVSRGFGGYLTKKGYEKLRNNHDIGIIEPARESQIID